MSEIFKTVIILSLLGTALIIPVLALKPITSRKFSASWQYIIWIVIMFSMLIPIYKLIPEDTAKSIITETLSETTYVIPIVPVKTALTPASPILPQNTAPPATSAIEEKRPTAFSLNILQLLTCIWIFGMCLFLVLITISYTVYIAKKRKHSVTVADNPILSQVKDILNIKTDLKLRMSSDVRSPMLVGIIKPTVYIPCREISEENLRMVFLHELTHLKRKDLVFKWISLIVNAVHWFNPFAYLLCANLSEACETSCDISVTKTMTDEEQKIYMKTILDLVE